MSNRQDLNDSRAGIVAPEPKKIVTWLHLSDWHQGLPDYDRSILLERMLDNIGRRAQIDRRLATIDAVIFSGDVAYSGARDEYQAVQADLVEPLRQMLGSQTRFIFAPGNHDVDQKRIADIPPDWQKLITSRSGTQRQVGDALFDSRKAPILLAPFENFYAFSARNGCGYPAGEFIFADFIGGADLGVAVVTINTALCCARHALHPADERDAARPWDYGALAISERQLREAIKRVNGARIKILVMHHPLSWMRESEQPILEQLVAANFDLVLYGHEHLPRFSSVSGNFGEIKFVPAGAAYAGRSPENPRYTNAFNFGLIDPVADEGAIFHRRWEDVRDRWQVDDRYWPDGIAKFLIEKNTLPNNVKYIFDAQRRYKSFHSKRAAKRAEITLKHKAITLCDRTFIQATIRYQIELYPGPAENFQFQTITNKRIEQHPEPAVRARAFDVVSMLPNPTGPSRDIRDSQRIVGSVELSDQSTTVEYHYHMLECADGIWCFEIGRFTDHVRIEIQRAEGFEYDFMPMGGFPDLQPGPERVWSFESLESDGGHLPGQGYMVQWYRKGT